MLAFETSAGCCGRAEVVKGRNNMGQCQKRRSHHPYLAPHRDQALIFLQAVHVRPCPMYGMLPQAALYRLVYGAHCAGKDLHPHNYR